MPSIAAECSGAGTEPYTDAQSESTAQLVAAASRALGLPINRSTVVVHADIKPRVASRRPLAAGHPRGSVRRVISRANAILRPRVVTVTEKTGDIVRVTQPEKPWTVSPQRSGAANRRWSSPSVQAVIALVVAFGFPRARPDRGDPRRHRGRSRAHHAQPGDPASTISH